ncbi:MAG: glycosyltransferase family 2 protein [Pseudomonadota bacterium]
MAHVRSLGGFSGAASEARAPRRVGPIPWDTLDELTRSGIIPLDRAESARRAAKRTGSRPEDIILHRRLATEAQIAAARATVLGVQLADLDRYPPERLLLDALGATEAIRFGVLPWRRLGNTTLVAAPSQEAFEAAGPALTASLGQCALVIAEPNAITQAILRKKRTYLTRLAETRVPIRESCRALFGARWEIGIAALAVAVLIALAFASGPVLLVATCWALLTLVATTLLKIAAAVISLIRKVPAPPDMRGLQTAALPRISILVPLYEETRIAQHLLARLQKLNYPRDRLDVILITERDDFTTRDTLAATALPHWFRHLTVPPGRVKTKPRALNFALDHCRGTIVGVYDAEDAPEPDQLLHVAGAFARAEGDVACLQGRLDYYNPEENWLSRCFTMEYAAWFRVLLPGLAALRFPVPLGGTTLFFRRAALEELHGWDAHNVTEDADLGLRLARKGLRTELIDTVTHEEANCRAWPWVRQRSRWLKGYAITYAAHMRRPAALWRDLGPWGFLGVQVLFLCTLSQFLLAPLLWSFWLVVFGWAHPILPLLPENGLLWIMGLFIISELSGFGLVALGLRQTRHGHIWPWMLLLPAYFPLGTAAAYKAAGELLGRPFYWDKTVHGVTLTAEP